MAMVDTLVYSVVPLTVRLPAITALPVTFKSPPTLMLPPALNAPVVLLNVKLALALAVPESLNIT